MSNGDHRVQAPWRITVESVLRTPDVERLFGFYLAAFEPVRTRAAARHLLTADEFAAEMADERIDKYVAWRSGRAVGLTTLTTDMAAIPWIEPRYYAARHPEHAARGTLFYLGYTVVDPEGDAYRVFKDMMDTVCRRFAEVQGVCAFDFSDYNANGAVGRIVRGLPASFGARVQEVDAQHYFVADFTGSAVPRQLKRTVVDDRPLADPAVDDGPPQPRG